MVNKYEKSGISKLNTALLPVNNTTLVKQAGRFKKDTKNTLKQLVIANQSMYTPGQN